MMDVVYILAVWAHIFAVAFWIGAMFFGDPESTRFFSKLFEEKLGGVGWYAHAVLWPTGLFMLFYRGISLSDLFSAELLSTSWGKTLWVKILLVLTLVGFQIVIGHKPSKIIYGYILISFSIIGLSTLLVRPVLF
jgi:hypothetical protein